MRMSPPSVSEGIREVLPGGANVQGRFIRVGFNTGTALYALHHHQDVVGDPFPFHPERLIMSDTVSAESVANAESAFFPFSMGSQDCPGKRLAYRKLTTALARLMFRMYFQSVPGDTKGEGSSTLMWGRRHKTKGQVDDALVVARDGPLIQSQRRAA